MKSIKFILPMLSILISLLLTSCNKNVEMTPSVKPEISTDLQRPITVEEAHKMGIYDDDSQDTEELIDDVKLPIDLNTRSATMSISAVTGDNFTITDENDDDQYGNRLCANPKYIGLPKLYREASLTIKGNGFGATQGNTTVTMTIGSVVYSFSDWNQWSDTLINVGIKDCVPAFTAKDVKQVAVKITITKGSESISKSIKALGDWTDGNNTDLYWYNGMTFGQAFWNIANERSKMGKPSLHFTVSATQNAQQGRDGFGRRIVPNYVPQVGDMVYRAKNYDTFRCVNEDDPNEKCDFISDYQPIGNAGVVMEVSEMVDNVRTVTIWEMNMKCTGALQKKKYKYAFGLFIPKKGELPFYGYAR